MSNYFHYNADTGFGDFGFMRLGEACHLHNLPYGQVLESALTPNAGAPYVQVYAHGEQDAVLFRIARRCMVAPRIGLMGIWAPLNGQQDPLIESMRDLVAPERPLVLPTVHKLLEIACLDMFADARIPRDRLAEIVWIRGSYGAASVDLTAMAGDDAALEKMVTVGGKVGDEVDAAKQVKILAPDRRPPPSSPFFCHSNSDP